MSGRMNPVYRTGYIRTSRRYLAGLKCYSGHNLYIYNLDDKGVTDITCDLCRRAVMSRDEVVYGCRECNIDICGNCHQSGRATQAAINQLTPTTPSPLQACCMVAIAQFPTESQRLTAAARGERYNHRRPNYRVLRVSERDYPDATEFGWTFTGSCEG